jgi:type I restriction enzyme S subunit
MVVDFDRVSLRDAGVSLIDCDHRTPPATAAGYPYIAIPQLKEGRLNLSDVRRIATEDFIEWTRKAKPREHDVILSRRCNPGETAHVPRDLECALGQNLVLLRSDGRKVHPPFLRWLVRGPAWWAQVGAFINVGAVFDSLRCADIPRFTMPLPSISAQRAIAAILGALDDRIELNRRINMTLQAMAEALYRSWFVDIDPTRAKVRSRFPLDVDPATADLFPSEFEQAAYGAIPTGWEIGRLDDALVLQRGFDLPASARTPGRYPVMAASGVNGYHDTFKVRGPGVTTGRSGVLGKVLFVHGDFWPLNTCLWVREFKRVSPAYAYHLLRSLDFKLFDAGSAVPTLNRNHVHSLEVILPPKAIVDAFDFQVMSLMQRQKANDDQSRTLAALRDTLLPKLLSGELSVANFESELATAG